jgi:hypothetical protein
MKATSVNANARNEGKRRGRKSTTLKSQRLRRLTIIALITSEEGTGS